MARASEEARALEAARASETARASEVARASQAAAGENTQAELLATSEFIAEPDGDCDWLPKYADARKAIASLPCTQLAFEDSS